MKITERFFNKSLSQKLVYTYIFFIMVSVLLTASFMYYFVDKETKSTISTITGQSIETLIHNIDGNLKSIAKTSTYLIGTTDIQNYVQNETSSESVILSKQLRNSLYLSLESMPLVSSIVIVKNNGIYDGAARYHMPQINNTLSITDTSWYQDVVNKKGGVIYQVNGDNYLQFPDGRNYITLIRLINNVENAHPLGVMFINIAIDDLLSYSQHQDNSYLDFCIRFNHNTILPFKTAELNSYMEGNSVNPLSSNETITIAGIKYLCVVSSSSDLDLDYIAAIKYSSITNQNLPIIYAFLLTIVVSIISFFLIALVTNHLITKPMSRFTKAINVTGDGNFSHVSITNYHDEIGNLQNEYNAMVDKIESLLEAKVTEQKLLRKAELNILQEQIKPHFLYNSLGAISYLVTSGQNDTAYNLILALSDYYRESLSKGSSIIPLSTEINIVKNYLKLQKVRFKDMFDDEYIIQENVLNYKIPRLILQPLAENALYHGIIPTGEYGLIKFEIYTTQEHLIIRISDNGVGMSLNQLQTILSSNLDKNKQSYGLRGTVERMQIFYDTQDIYHICSVLHEGTTITFSIPLNRMEEIDNEES